MAIEHKKQLSKTALRIREILSEKGIEVTPDQLLDAVKRDPDQDWDEATRLAIIGTVMGYEHGD